MYLLNDVFAPVTSEMGYLKNDVETIGLKLLEWQSEINQDRKVTLSLHKIVGKLTELLMHLLPLTDVEHRRYLLVPVGNGWTAYFDNGVRGSDPASIVYYLAGTLKCQGLRVACVPDTMVGKGRDARGRFGATILEIYSWNSLKQELDERAICLVNDGGRWSFDQYGEPYSFEDLSSYEKRRVKDRFTPEMLKAYVEALGVRCFDEDAYTCDESNPAYLIEKKGACYRNMHEYTLEQARERF